MIGRLLCGLGFHDWDLFFYDPWRGGRLRVRQCGRCDRSERWTERAAWSGIEVIRRGRWVTEREADD